MLALSYEIKTCPEVFVSGYWELCAWPLSHETHDKESLERCPQGTARPLRKYASHCANNSPGVVTKL